MYVRPTHRLTFGVVAAASALVLAGCTGSDGPFKAPVPNPCDTLDTAMINETLGSEYDDAKPNELQSNDRQSVCEWWSKDQGGTFVQVLIKVDATSVTAERESANNGLGATVDEKVVGATDAYSMLSGAMIGMAVDDYFVQVGNLTGKGGDLTLETTALAEAVAAAISE